MEFCIKKGNDELKNTLNEKGFNFKDDNFYILFTQEKIAGHASFTLKNGYVLLDEIVCEIDDFKIYDALLRAIAFYGTERMYQYVVYDGKDEKQSKEMLSSIFNHYKENVLLKTIYLAENLDFEKALYVDSVWLFSQKCGSESDK